MALLLSPITWRAHAVAIVPACYLLIRHAAAGGEPRPSARAAVAMLIVISLILSRGVVGSTVDSLVHAYSLLTWTLVVLMFATWRTAHSACRPAAA